MNLNRIGILKMTQIQNKGSKNDMNKYMGVTLNVKKSFRFDERKN